MSIKCIPWRVKPSEIEPVVDRRRSLGPGATPALQSTDGLKRRTMPPEATRPRATVPTRAAAQAEVPLNQGASTSKMSLADLFQMEDEQGRKTAPASHAPAQPAASAPAGVADGLAATGPGVARSTNGRLGAESILRAMATQLPAENSQRSQRSQQPSQFSAPTGDLPAIPEKKKVSFAGAEQRTFDPVDNPKTLQEPARIPFPSDAGAGARGESLARSSSEAALANRAANGAATKARTRYVNQLGDAVARLQYLAIKSPERVQQAIQKGVLPAEVLGDRLDPQFVEDILDLHAQFHEWQTTAPALGRTDFSDAGGVASVIVEARKRFAEQADSQAALLALMAETGATSSPPVPRALNAEQLTMMTAALNGGGQALGRMSERAERENAEPAKTMLGRLRQAGGKPKRLEGARRNDFVALVDRDIAALATKLRIEPRHAADLLQRAVHVGQMGADTLRPQDRSLLLEVLAAKALNGGG